MASVAGPESPTAAPRNRYALLGELPRPSQYVSLTGVHGRIARIHEAIRGAAGADPEARAVWEKVQTERAIGAQHVIADLEQKSPLRRDLDRQEAIDLLWTLIDPSHYLQLVHHRGWTAERFQAWLTATLQAQLLDPRRRRSGRR